MPLFGAPDQPAAPAQVEQISGARLAATAGAAPDGLFTSDLSVSEYVLLQEAGFEPLGFVVGSSVFHIGLQPQRWGTSQELTNLTRAMYDGRELAMGRMRAEADRLGADGVVGVRLNIQAYLWGQDVLEFLCLGTAVRASAGHQGHRAPDGRAFTSNLDSQDFYRLLAAGSVPVSFVMGTCVYHVAIQGVLASLKQTFVNQEMQTFTEGVYVAREAALSRMHGEAARDRASGVVGVDLQVQSHVWGMHATEFFAVGTSIRTLDPQHRLADTAPKPTFTLGLDR